MDTKEILEHLERIRKERLLEAHHDDIFGVSYPDIDALDKVTALIKLLHESAPSDTVKISELLKAADIESRS